MCLDYLTPLDVSENDIFYKEFLLTQEKRVNGVYYRAQKMPIGEWIHEYQFRELRFQEDRFINTSQLESWEGLRSFYNGSGGTTMYEFGFHCYLEEYAEPERAATKPVKVRNIVATGRDSGIPTVVAKEIKILDEEEKDGNTK